MGQFSSALNKYLQVQLSQPDLLILVILIVIVVIALLYRETRARAAQSLLRNLATRQVASAQGHFRIRPYRDIAEDKNYRRPDDADTMILSWLRRTEGTPLYLTGESGTGKSSLVAAFVIPRLKKLGWLTKEVRAWQNPLRALAQAFDDKSGQEEPGPEAIRCLIETASSRSPRGILIVMDQFEEYIILHEPGRSDLFRAFIQDLHDRPIQGVRFLLVMRSEYSAALHEREFPRFRQGENWQQVGPFTQASGLSFLRQAKLGLDLPVLSAIVKSASELDQTPGLVRPITLNVLGLVLERGIQAPGQNASELVRQYITQSLNRLHRKDLAHRILEFMISDQGTKIPRAETQIAKQTGLGIGEIRATLIALSDDGLTRPIDEAQAIWEISHDFLANAISRALGRDKFGRLSRVSAAVVPALAVTIFALIGWWSTIEGLIPTPPRVAPVAYLRGDSDVDAITRNPLQFFGKARTSPDPEPGLKESAFEFPNENHPSEKCIKGPNEPDTDASDKCDGPGKKYNVKDYSFVKESFSATLSVLPTARAERTVLLWAFLTERPAHESFLAGYGMFNQLGGSYVIVANDPDGPILSDWQSGMANGHTMLTKRWYCIAAVSSPDKDEIRSELFVYLDGEQVENKPLSAQGPGGPPDRFKVTTAQASDFYVGALPNEVVKYTVGWRRATTGFIKKVSIYDRALSKANIRYICGHPEWEPK